MIPYTKYELLDKWLEPDFERLADICERCKKARREKKAELTKEASKDGTEV